MQCAYGRLDHSASIMSFIRFFPPSEEEESAIKLLILDHYIFGGVTGLFCLGEPPGGLDPSELSLLVDWKKLCQKKWCKYWPIHIGLLTKHLLGIEEVGTIMCLHPYILDKKGNSSRFVYFAELEIPLQRCLKHSFHGGKYKDHYKVTTYAAAGDAAIRLGLHDVCEVACLFFERAGIKIPPAYDLHRKCEFEIARCAARNKIMGIVYDALGLNEISGWDEMAFHTVNDLQTKGKGTVFEIIFAMVYARGEAGCRVCKRMVYMFLQILIWLADKEDSAFDQHLHYKACPIGFCIFRSQLRQHLIHIKRNGVPRRDVLF